MSHPLETIFLSFIGGVEPFILLAVPLFIFTGELLAQGGVGKRIVEFARVLFGWLPGGLGVVTVDRCTLFGGVSGSAIADTAAIGSLVIPAMVARGYSRGFAAALLAVAGTMALADAVVDPLPGLCLHLGRVDAHAVDGRPVAGACLGARLIAVCMWHGKSHGRATTADAARRQADLGRHRLSPGPRS
jgi:C4-dicarboxylate transporter DctM subunit